MKKNEILNNLLGGLMDQRKSLIRELSEINFNESSHFEKRTTFEAQINSIDSNINSLTLNIEIL